MLPLAVDRSSFGGVAIRYVLSVFCMTSRFHIMGPMARRVIPMQREASVIATVSIPTKFHKTTVKYSSWVAQRGGVCYLQLPRVKFEISHHHKNFLRPAAYNL